ncbi:Golgi SNAP receptor complex member 2-like [Ruditapes philippinarum]|uniref:Golgi SNAP receptor complex member 2-like n=1 Tax=Ruditapes philippinarum TaxID=129788 RepID=UPI00295B7547|nr:Golgi SNAP receptor complex member 2-like [Ruditapes philippinarum]
METLYHQTYRLIQEVQSDLGKYERATGEQVHHVENEIQAHIDHILSNCERLDILVNKEPPTRRSNAKMKADQLKYDCQHLQSALRQLQHRRYQREQEDLDREALLTRRFERNDADTTIAMDAGLQHNTKLNDANRDMDNLLGHGSSILTSLKDQRLTLKNAHKRILDIANTLGLSNTVMRFIERRTTQDKFILYTGMVVTCIIMFLAWKYLT